MIVTTRYLGKYVYVIVGVSVTIIGYDIGVIYPGVLMYGGGYLHGESLRFLDFVCSSCISGASCAINPGVLFLVTLWYRWGYSRRWRNTVVLMDVCCCIF